MSEERINQTYEGEEAIKEFDKRAETFAEAAAKVEDQDCMDYIIATSVPTGEEGEHKSRMQCQGDLHVLATMVVQATEGFPKPLVAEIGMRLIQTAGREAFAKAFANKLMHEAELRQQEPEEDDSDEESVNEKARREIEEEIAKEEANEQGAQTDR